MNYLYRIVRHPGIYMATSALLVLLVMIAVAWQTIRNIEADREIPLVKALGTYAATLEGGTTNSRAMGAAMLFGLENSEAKQLALGKRPSDAPKVWLALDTLRTLHISDAAFLVNKQGVIVAYSSKDNTRATGRDLSFLPYVQLALQGTPNVYPAVGINNNRGIYLAAPVRAGMNNTSGVIGAIVVKVGADKLDALLKSWTDGTVVLLSPQGVAFAASREDWLFHMTGKMSANRLADIQRTRQFGKVFDHAPPQSLPFMLDTPETSIDGVHYAVRSLPLEWNDPEGDWVLALLDRRAPWWTQWSVLGFASLAGLIAALTLFWLYTLARNAVLRQENYHELESTQKLLRLNETRLHTIIDNSPIGIWLVGPDGRYQFLNKTFCDAIGISESEFLSAHHLADVMEPEAAAGCLKSDRECLEQDEPHLSHEVLTFVDGNQHMLEITKVKLHDDTGRVTGIIGISIDITEQRAREKALRESEEKYRELFDNANDFLYCSDLSGVFTSINNKMLEMTGYARDELVGQPISKILTPDNLAIAKGKTAAKLSGETETTQYNLEILAKEGHMTTVEISSRLIYQDGKPMGVQGIGRDITARRKREAELRAANQKAEDATRAKSMFLANMSHEIRTPMNAIIGLSDLALGANPTPRMHDYLSKIYVSSRALLNIINDILDFSKVEAGRMDIEAEEFHLEALLQNASNLFSVQAEEKGLELAFEIGLSMPSMLVGDSMRLGQVMNNLVGNAVKFTAQGEVHIKVCQVAEEPGFSTVNFQIRDTGIGMSAEQVTQLFQAFSQADGSITRRFGGTGLGLAISKRLVELMGGDIAVQSCAGVGSTFSFTLRLPVVKNESLIREAIGLRVMRVLIVDDLDISRQILREIFTAWGFQVDEAESGVDALEQLKNASALGQPFGLVMLDWKMPGMDGVQVTRTIREEVRNKNIHAMPVVVMVTAFAKEQLMKDAQDVLLDAVLTKPVLPSTLLDTITRLQGGKVPEDVKQIRRKPEMVSASLRGARILLVEDHEINQMVAREFLQNAGLHVTIANNGQEGVAAVLNGQFDAVLMDLHMPVMDGFEAARLIREDARFKNLPIIAMTAAVMTKDREASYAAGMDDHVSKPIMPEMLLATLSRWIDREAYAAPERKKTLPADEMSATLPKLPGFNFEQVSAMLNGNHVMLKNLLRQFCEKFSNTADELENLVHSGKVGEAVLLVHGIKGAAGNLGAVELYQAARLLEEKLAAGATPSSMNAFKHALADTLKAIVLFTETGRETTAVSGAHCDKCNWQTVADPLGRLRILLEGNDYVPQELMLEIKERLPCQSVHQHLHQVEKHLGCFDYAPAKVVLTELECAMGHELFGAST